MTISASRRDEKLYLENIVIRVEDTLFRVPRQIFAESDAFGGMFTMPQEHTPDGSSDEHPLVLEGIATEEFRLFSQAAIVHTIGGTASIPMSGWAAVLRLADMWTLDTLRAGAIAHLATTFTDADAAVQLDLAMRFNVTRWVRPAVARLVKRASPFTQEEIELLGAEMVARILPLRDWSVKMDDTPVPDRPLDQFCAPLDMEELIERAFDLEYRVKT